MSKKNKKSAKKSSSKTLNLSEKNNLIIFKPVDYLSYIIAPIFVSLPIVFILYDWYYAFQISKLSNNDTILFIYDKISVWVIFVSPGITIFLVILVIRKYLGTKFMKIKICSIIVITMLLISTFILLWDFFDYTNIDKEGIHIRKNVFSNNIDYEWSDITYAKVSYSRGNKNAIIIAYDIYLNDGQVVHTYNSREFFDDIISLDSLMQNEKVTINRQKIASNDYNDFVRRFKDDESSENDRLEVILKIFDK